MKDMRYSFDTEDEIVDETPNNIEDEIFDVNKDDDDDKLDYEYDLSDEPGSDDENDEKEVYEEENINDDPDEQEVKLAKRHVKRSNRNASGQVRRNKKFIVKRVSAIILTLVGTSLCAAASPIFAARNIVINELHYFTKDEVCNEINLSTGVNGIFYNKSKAEKILTESPYISSAEISFKLPSTMIVSVNENRVCAYIEYLGSFLYLDRNGYVIDIQKETNESLPIIEGLKFSSFTINNEIPVENKDAFKSALSVSNAMNKYGVLEEAVSINVSDGQNLYAYINNIKVLLGDSSRMEEKIKTMAEAVKEIPKEDRGTLDLTDLSKPIIFKYAT